MSTPTITVGQAVSLINDSILNFQDGLSKDTIDSISYAINNDIQVRDYMLGLPDTFGLDTCVSFIKYVGSSVSESEIVPFATVASAYEYEQGNVEVSAMLISQVMEIDETYTLANLLDRVFKAGWSADSFVEMRKELHPKVVEMLEEMQDQLI